MPFVFTFSPSDHSRLLNKGRSKAKEVWQPCDETYLNCALSSLLVHPAFSASVRSRLPVRPPSLGPPPDAYLTMNNDSSLDRTARWVQAHSHPSYRQYHAAAPAAAYYQGTSSSRNRTRNERQQDGLSSQQSSRTDLGGQDYGVGSKGRSHTRASSSAMAVAGSSVASHRVPGPEPLSSTPHRHPHQRSRSASHSHSIQTEQSTQPRLNIHSSLYRHPQLPAFVQGPPGSGYPMAMSTAAMQPVHPQHPVRAAVPSPPSPPLQVPAPLNPKVRICRQFSLLKPVNL